MDIQQGEEMSISVGRAEEEAVVYMTASLCQQELIVERFQRGGLRNGIGHIEIRGDAPEGCRPTLALDIGLLRESWLTEMYMVVDDARKNKTPRGINRLVELPLGC